MKEGQGRGWGRGWRGMEVVRVCVHPARPPRVVCGCAGPVRPERDKRQDPEAEGGIRVCGGRSLQPVPTRQRSEQQGIGGRRNCYCTLCNWILCLAGIFLLNRTYSSITEKGGRQRCCSLLGLTDIMIGVDKLG